MRFVEVTEVVHALILNSQFARMRFTQRVHDAFRTLAVEGGGVGRVLAEAAALTELPVVLEDLGHRALSFAAGEVSAATLLKDWTARSRQVPAAAHPATAGPRDGRPPRWARAAGAGAGWWCPGGWWAPTRRRPWRWCSSMPPTR